MSLSIRQEVAQQIVTAIKDVCSHDINFINSKGIIYASTNPKRIGDFHEIGMRVIKTGETIEVSENDNFFGTQKGVNIPIIHKEDVSAVIGISGDPEEARKYAYMAQKIATLLLREYDLEIHEHTKKTQLNHVIRALIFHEYLNPDYLKSFLKKHNTSLDTNYQTILVQLDSRYNPSNLALVEQYIYKAFESTQSTLFTFNYPNEYIMFLESKKLPKWLYVFEQLSQKYAPLLRIGIGHSVPLSRQYLSYQSAKLAIDSLFFDEYLAIFDNLDLEILLGDTKEDTKKFFLEKTILKLNSKDYELLRTYFSTNMSLKDTAEQLYLHKNTLQYQLDRIGRITGYNPRNFKDATVLYIGLKLITNEETTKSYY